MLLWNIFQLVFQLCFILRSTYSQTESTAGNCSSPMTRDLHADQFSASSEYDVAHNASSARYGYGGWIAGTKNTYQYLTVDLEGVWEITKLTFHDSDKGWYSRAIRVSYSHDGYVWMPYNTHLSDDARGELFERQGKTTAVAFNPSLKARFITINPVSYYRWMYPSLVIEFFGCKNSATPTTHVTTAGNSIDIDTTWIPSQSPIIVNSPVVIRPAATLTIQAGVLVIFTKEEAGIEVWGTLISDGIPGLSVLLTSSDPVLSAHSQWRGITQKTGGSLTIGKQTDEASRTTVLKLDGKVSWSNKWNGVSMTSSDVKIYNAVIYGMDTLLEVTGSNSTIVINNFSTTKEKIQHLIYGNVLNGSLSLHINEISLSTESTLAYIRTINSDIHVDIEESNLQSEEYVFDIRESNSQTIISLVDIYISNSLISSPRSSKWNMFLEGCSSHLTSRITGSRFSAINNYYGLTNFNYLSVDMMAVGNTFGDAEVSLRFAFCGDVSSNFSKEIKITGNHFNSSLAGSDLLINGAVTDGHTFYIANNTFDSHHVASRKGINCERSRSISLHTLYINSNVFTNIEHGAVDVFCRLKMVITNNLFISNKKCIVVIGYSAFHPIESLEIIGNEFINNTDPDGIIYLHRDEFGIQTVNITENTFEGNTGIVIALKTHKIRLKYNFFNNEHAFYNIKVLKDYVTNPESINASLNYWGTSNPREISKGIYDFDYDSSLFHVEFRPYLGSKNISDVQNAEYGFISESGEIGGKVNGNITLRLKDSPFLVISNINVEENDTLTIEAGVELRVRQGVGIFVKGKLFILGTKDLPVKLSPEEMGLPWRGIDFNSASDAVLSHIDVNDTDAGITIRSSAFSISNVSSTFSRTSGISRIFSNKQKEMRTTLYFSNVTLEDNSEAGITISGDSDTAVIISNCTVTRNKEDGIKLSTNARIEVTNCLISENGESGVSISQSNGGGMLYINNSVIASNTNYALKGTVTTGVVVDSCEVRNHTYEYINYWGRRYTHGYIELERRYSYKEFKSLVLFKNTLFQGNTADWIEISDDEWVRGEIEIRFENNIFTEGRRTFLCKTYSSNNNYQINIYFQNNTLEKNSVLEETTENVLVEFLLFANPEYHIEITGNLFRENIAQSCLVVPSNYIDISNGEMNILENVFKDNNFSSSVVNIQTHVPLEMHRNIFDFPHTYRCAVEVHDFDLDLTFNATHNYWGTSVTKEVIETVCGFEKDMSRSIVWTFPFYANEELSTLISETHTLASNVFGGEISKDTHILPEEKDSTVEVHRSIIVREGAKLYIDSGVTLLFAPDRGIYVQGALSIIGSNLSVVSQNIAHESPWYGIVINTTSHNRTERVQIYRSRLQNTLHGIVAHTANFEIKSSEITESAANCLTLFETEDITIYDFGNTTFKSCDGVGINITGNVAVTIINANIQDTSVGIGTKTFSGLLDVRSCTFINCSVGISLSSQRYDDNSVVKISRNSFQEITSTALTIVLSKDQLAKNNTNRTVNVDLNTFQNACGVEIQTWNHVEMTFRDNDLLNASCLKEEDDCFMNVFSSGSDMFEQNRYFDISANRFENISAKCIIQLKDNDVSNLQNTFVHNTVSNSKARDGVILANGRYFNISNNIFDNPDSVFDVITVLKGTNSINVTNNWWGSPDPSNVFSRIFDQRRQADLILFEVEPVLLDRLVDCTAVNNCSSHGECISPNHCRCSSGWTGMSCMQYDCSGVNNCYGNGDCIGPNTCSCNDGWSGKQCILASCLNVSNCSGHGFCVRPNVCACAARFTGDDCSLCIPQHGGPSCQPCPMCQHGSCDPNTGLCKCESNNWTGYLCDRCSETFYGPDCLPLIKVLEIIPSRGPEKGGNDVHVWGHNFLESLSGAYKCRFGDTKTDGKWLAWNHVLCTAPRLPEGEVTLEVSPDGSKFTNDRQTYFFYSTCPPESCGRNFSPSRGQCVFGSCSCFLPWKGKNCTIEILPPIIAVVSSEQTVNETQTYTQQLKLEQGDLPVRWYLFKGPVGMTVDEKTGLVGWSNAFAKSDKYQIDVRVSNIIGEDTVTWSLSVPLSYTAFVQYIEPSGIFPAPRSVKVFGKIDFLRDEAARTVSVEVIVTSRRSKHVTILKAVSDQSPPDTFMTIYYPRPDDAGLFSVTARHPGETLKSNTSNVTWSVLGMQCKPSTATVDEIISADDDAISIANISRLVNVGDTYIDNITSEVDGLPGAYIGLSGDFSGKSFALQRLQTNENISFNLIITNAKPLYGHIYIIFTTRQGTSTGMRVNIKLSARKPVLILKPPSLRESVVRGTLKVFDVNITNIGEVSANNLSVSLPRDSRFSLVSFTSKSNWVTESDDNSVALLPNDVAYLSIAVVIEETESLGEISGHIYINSVSTSSRLPYKIFITSIGTFNVTFTVKDEYTYFASGSPLVTNAKVRLSNPRRKFYETKYTGNETGYVIFEDIYEDQYTLYAEADDHSTYGAVILITSDSTEQDIFLPRIAVKYTWTVEPTTVEDVYIIELESTFETYVPMPVVTLQPAQINTIPLEQEQTSTIEFTITNHGLIRADNVRFSLPTTHPYLNFEAVVDYIGSIAANTSIVVPVRTKLKQREKRSTGSCVSILLLYSFECSGIQTRSALSRLTRGDISGRSCFGSIFHGHGRLSGRGSGHASAYIASTALTCDCLQTFFKSCILAFLPGYGCPLALYNFVTADHSSANVKDEVLGMLDIVVGCLAEDIVDDLKKQFPKKLLVDLLKKNLPVIEHLYTAVRCVQDVEAKCSGGRSRREINSDVLNAVVRASGPMMNFISLAKEIIGQQSVALEEAWYNEFKKSVGDDTELGVMLSETESSAILYTITEEAYKTNLSSFLSRYNNTAAAWENGTLSKLEDTGKVISFKRLKPRVEQFINDIDKSKARVFDSIFDEYEYAVKTYYDAEGKESSSGAREKEGVCARVRIRIEQELVLTRDAFKAKLEIENGETSDLENIKVQIEIKQTFGSGDLLNDNFSIGKPSLIGISSVDGTGRLGRDLSGSAEWLIIPYSKAAPVDDTQYDIGGQLSYRVGGTEFSVPLLPDTITVSPNPSLIVHYFHEKYVRGDDALTPEIEPIIPFTLAVMVTNDGYGVARALKITSGQPEIIENKKGLLVTFKIIAAQLGNYPVAPSLTVDFGDISSFETKTARWLMTSSLMGKFYNYSATFENINPLGDPQLSLIDKLEYHDLFHLVRIEFPDKDDGLDDFLVNNFPDQESIPDRLYNSANGTDVSDVFFVNITDVHVSSFVSSSMKNYKQVNLTLYTKTSTWVYARIENTFTSSDRSTIDNLLNAVSQYGRNILLDKNIWQTTHILDSFYLHLFDFIEKDNSIDDKDETEMVYTLTYGPKNSHAPRFDATFYSAKVPKGTNVGSEVVRVTAYDNDKDNLQFKLRNYSDSLFDIRTITPSSVAITVSDILTVPGLSLVELVVHDDGIPPRSSVVNISIVVVDSDRNNASTDSSLETTKHIPSTWSPSTEPDSSTETQSTYTTQSNEADKISSDEILSWVIPLAIGCTIVLILIIVGLVCLLRKKQVIFSRNDNTFELK
ncbi:uncharacterized protein LOC128548542 isoform X2 [Mercenaria mercenaria]|uniref:uncharacterized protein LOC128548542 isoform X2 n=1 Tax=Mercenaria mercenaria TaxID=6596 RepID=UPI00234F663C|nr:uncharacterized protein LOC128548542 isoform X2 [Mercenaria mercenaria]